MIPIKLSQLEVVRTTYHRCKDCLLTDSEAFTTTLPRKDENVFVKRLLESYTRVQWAWHKGEERNTTKTTYID